MTASTEIISKHKVLLLDDDPDVLDLYQQMLLQLPCKPEVHIATSGARAMSMLDSEPFNLLVSDLRMPKMDGLQVITIVRRKHPQLRTIVLTGVADEEMRARAYAMGIDLYLEKPSNSKELTFLMQCIEGLLEKEKAGAGFRGVQSKSLVDLIQLECLSGSSSVLKITNGKTEGRIWIRNGEVIDATTPDAEGEAAFKRILCWKTGNFEIVPMQSERPRRIKTSYQGLLLDTVQAEDEAKAEQAAAAVAPETGAADGQGQEAGQSSDTQFFQKGGLGRIQGVEFAIKLSRDNGELLQKWGLENAAPLAEWTRGALKQFQALGDKFDFGDVKDFEGRDARRQLHIELQGDNALAIGLLPTMTREQIDQSTQKVLERWAS